MIDLRQRLTSAVFLASFASIGAASMGAKAGTEPGRTARPASAPPAMPAVTIAVYRDKILFGELALPVKTSYPLVEAMRLAPPGSNPVFGIYGDISRPNAQAGSQMQIGGGDSNAKDYVAHWGPTPMRFAVVGMTEDARIRQFDLRDHMNSGQQTGGVADAMFANLTIEARYSRCVGAPQGHRFGKLRLYGCRFVGGREAIATGQHGGYGMKWGIRATARGTWDVRNCHFDRVEEHCWYIDSPCKVNRFLDNTMDGAGRTMGQIVNRSVANPGIPGNGVLLFERNHARRIWGEGGSAFTVAGFLGDVIFRDNTVTSSSLSHGALVVWSDDNPIHGLQLNPNGFTTNRVLIDGMSVRAPQSDRDHISISGVEEVVLGRFEITGNKTALSLDDPRGGPIPNGSVRFEQTSAERPLSRYPGFRSARKIKLGGTVLTDAQIDLRWPTSGGHGGSPPETPGSEGDPGTPPPHRSL